MSFFARKICVVLVKILYKCIWRWYLLNFITKLSKSFFNFIRLNLDMSDEEIEKIQYGMQIIFMNMFKIVILFVPAFFLKVFSYTLIAFISFGFLRTFACGVHAHSSIVCIVINYVVFLGNVFLSLNFLFNPFLIAVLYLISLILVIKYAPADTAERPLISKKLRKALKVKASVLVIIMYILTILLKNPIYKNILAYSVLEEAIFITPLAYLIVGSTYNNYKNVQF